MKIIAAVRIGRYGRQYKPGDVLDVSPAHARLYVASKQARYEKRVITPDDAPGTSEPRAPRAPKAETKPQDARQAGSGKQQKGRHRRRDMRAEGDGD